MSELRKLLAMRRENPRELYGFIVERHAERGFAWLNRHAPIGWYRNLYQPRADGETASFRVYTKSNTESVLALAFEQRDDLIDQFGYVCQYVVAKHFGLNLRQQFLLGFDAGVLFRSLPGQADDWHATGEMLNKAWKRVIARKAAEITGIPHRHQTPAEQAAWERMREYDFLSDNFLSDNPSLWSRIRARWKSRRPSLA